MTCDDFETVIRSATHESFLFCDPPYWLRGCELYQFGLSENDHIRLRDSLQATDAKWLLSYDDHERVRDLYSGKGIKIAEIRNSNTIVTAGGNANRKTELLISNY